VPYVLRHTFASNALAAGVGTFELARYMGTSVEMIERTYGHLVTTPTTRSALAWMRSRSQVALMWRRPRSPDLGSG
jgi:integrase